MKEAIFSWTWNRPNNFFLNKSFFFIMRKTISNSFGNVCFKQSRFIVIIRRRKWILILEGVFISIPKWGRSLIKSCYFIIVVGCFRDEALRGKAIGFREWVQLFEFRVIERWSTGFLEGHHDTIKLKIISFNIKK